MTRYNVYCDESCHLEHDHHPIMVLGAIWCPLEKASEIAVRIREIKRKHNLASHFEVKWTKVSPSKQAFYLDLLDYFFDDDDLHFRALIANDKNRLRHKDFNQDHDAWYYKMYFDMLKILFSPTGKYYVYLDIKDTRSTEKIAHLHDVLCNNMYDFERAIITRLQPVRSNEIAHIQLADLITGIIGYANRNLSGNAGKVALVNRMRQRSGYSLQKSTLYREEKVNLFHWTPREQL